MFCALLALCSLAGCAGSGGGFGQAAKTTDAWYGEYQGTGRVSIPSESLWLENQPVTLNIDQAQRNQLRLWGRSSGEAGSHFFQLEVPFGAAANVLEGSTTQVRSAGGEKNQHFKAEYALTRQGNTLKGTVKILSAPIPAGPFFSGDEWVVDLRRVDGK